MKTIVYALALAVTLTSCHAQEKKTKNDVAAHNSETEMRNEPKGTWKVNKEVDENGNLVRYDSIYTYSYGNINGKEIAPQKQDSIMASFENYIKERSPLISQQLLNPFKGDTLGSDFYENNVFQNH